MMMLKDMKMKPKLTILFVAAGILPLLVVGWWNARITSKALMQSSYAQLKNVREIKKKHKLNAFLRNGRGIWAY